MTVLSRISRFLLTLVAFVLFSGAALLSDEPLVADPGVPSARDVGTAQTIAQMVVGALRGSGTGLIAARGDDLPAAARAVSYGDPNLAVSVRLGEGEVPIAASYRLAQRTWVNIRIEPQAFAVGEPPRVVAAMGAVELPPWVTRWLADRGLEILWPSSEPAEAPSFGDLLQAVTIGEEHVAAKLRLPPELLRTARRLRLGESEEAAEAAKATYLRLTRPERAFRQPDDVAVLLADAFSAPGGPVSPDAAAGRLTGTLMAGYLTDLLRMVDPEVIVRPSSRPKSIPVTLAGRRDLALHFMISAVLAAREDRNLANALGEMKELSDSLPGGSGFSFVDLAADRAGQRLGMLLRDPETSALTQARLAQARPGDLFPARALGMQEGLSTEEFEQRFGQLDGSRYGAAVARIDAALDALPLYAAESAVSRNSRRQARRSANNGGG